MANVCEHCKRSMSTHDNRASCPQCRMAAGECSLDSENPCTICCELAIPIFQKPEAFSQVPPVGGRLSNFMEGWKHITNDPYVLSIVAKGYRLRFTSPPLLRQTRWEIRSPQDPQEILGMREQIFLMLGKNTITEVPPDSPGSTRTYSLC